MSAILVRIPTWEQRTGNPCEKRSTNIELSVHKTNFPEDGEYFENPFHGKVNEFKNHCTNKSMKHFKHQLITPRRVHTEKQPESSFSNPFKRKIFQMSNLLEATSAYGNIDSTIENTFRRQSLRLHLRSTLDSRLMVLY
ncbi:unnamed protein product [Allacma fusca]|uniref:Uncharacterized protein n=1 Tax=Allacma fusca TaxID=39272 RepID=A0A8J2JVV8_9HEXA|nr:unnamed protein product [Allacma fusca]